MTQCSSTIELTSSYRKGSVSSSLCRSAFSFEKGQHRVITPPKHYYHHSLTHATVQPHGPPEVAFLPAESDGTLSRCSSSIQSSTCGFILASNTGYSIHLQSNGVYSLIRNWQIMRCYGFLQLTDISGANQVEPGRSTQTYQVTRTLFHSTADGSSSTLSVSLVIVQCKSVPDNASSRLQD